MIVSKGLGSNRLVTRGLGSTFDYADAVPTIAPPIMSLGGSGALPIGRLGYIPYRERPPGYVTMPRRPRRPSPPPEPDVQPEVVDVAVEAVPAPPAAPTKPAPGVLSGLGDPVAAKTDAAPDLRGPAQAAAPQARGWSTGAKVALAVGAVGTAGLCVAAGYLIGRRLRAKAVVGEEAGFCCGGRELPEARVVRDAKPRPRARKRRKS